MSDCIDRLRRKLNKISAAGHKICIITDDTESHEYLGPAYDAALEYTDSVNMMALRTGMADDPESISGIYEALKRWNFSEGDILIALGGMDVIKTVVAVSDRLNMQIIKANTKKQINYYPYFGLIIILGLFADRLTKALAEKYLKSGRIVHVIPGLFDFMYVENRGAAFGALQGRQVLFYIITAIVVVGIIYIILKAPKTRHHLPLCYTLSCILTGAVGNFIDRITRQFVVDFIYFIPIDFPVFNVADIFVTLGSIALLYEIIFVYKDKDFDFLSRG